MTFENQNQRAKLRLELSEGVLVEVPLAVVVRAIQERYMLAGRYEEKATAESAEVPSKDLVHWGFKDFFSDDPRAMVHLVVTTRPEPVKRTPVTFGDIAHAKEYAETLDSEGDS